MQNPAAALPAKRPIAVTGLGIEGWRPFALSILEEHFADYAARPARSPFMIMAFDVAEAKRGDIPSAMHSADHTTRSPPPARGVP